MPKPTMFASTPVVLLALGLAVQGCSKDDTATGSSGGGRERPERVTEVTSSGFSAPNDAVSSHDGKTFYFSGFTEADHKAAVFRVPAGGGSAEPLHAGSPLEYPTGLVLSCDSATLWIADMRTSSPDSDLSDVDDSDAGALYSLRASGGTPEKLAADGIAVPSGLALSVDCKTLYVTGYTEDRTPALFSLPTAGGGATVIHAGAPLVSPTGVHVDKDGVAWVMDHLALGAKGPGVLFAIGSDGSVKEVMSGIQMGTPGGVSLTSAGGVAVMPIQNDDGAAELVTVSLATAEVVNVAASGMKDPAGLRTARDAAVFAVVDHEGGAIFRAE